MDQQPLAAVEDPSKAAGLPHSPVAYSLPDSDPPAPQAARTTAWRPLPEPHQSRLVLPILLSVSLGIHVLLVALSALMPKPAEAARLGPSQVEFNLAAPPVPEEIEAMPEPEPEPEPEPVVRPRRAAPEPAPESTEPPPPAPVMVAEGPGTGSDWSHTAGEEGGVLGSTPGGTGTGAVAPPPPVVEEPPPTPRGLSRQELRRRVLAYIRGTLSSFVNGRLDYPLEARQNHLEGVVVLRLRLDEGGELVSVRLSRTSGHRLLDRAALACVQNLRTVPAPPGSIPWDPDLEIPLPITYRLQ